MYVFIESVPHPLMWIPPFGGSEMGTKGELSDHVCVCVCVCVHVCVCACLETLPERRPKMVHMTVYIGNLFSKLYLINFYRQFAGKMS